MKAKLPIHKSRSPPRRDLVYEDELIEELEDTRHRRQLPNAFLVNKKPGKVETVGFMGRKACSNSPKGVSAKNGKNYRNINKYQSPIPRNHSPFEVYRNKVTEVNLFGNRKPKTKHKLSPEPSRFLRRESPRSSGTEEAKALKLFAKRRHQLNKDLWEAAENGDLVKIAQLLEP
jgi:hypothetical protein